jgi:hypothetical protein
MTIKDILVSREDLAEVEITEQPLPSLAPGETLLLLERFGFSANNITYATLGDAMGYWKFFPAADGWGSVPVWGYASVVDSEAPAVSAGERYFGYFPLSTHLVVTPTHVTPRGFVDGAAHRAELPGVYQRYMRVPEESEAGGIEEDQQSLWRPLFLTAFGAADFISEANAWGAPTIVSTSASSKTAMATAFCLKQAGVSATLLGFTSPSNVALCERTGYYDRVLSYGEVDGIADSDFALIDFAGNGKLLTEIEHVAGERLLRTVIVGGTHWDQRERSLTSGGAATEFFFLPTWIEKRREDWGSAEFMRRGEEAWETFSPTTKAWLRIEEHVGPAEIIDAYRAVLTGGAQPDVGLMLAF